MTVKELIEKLQEYPEDKEVVMWGEKGYCYYDEADCITGFFPVAKVEEVTFALNKNLIGKIKLSINN